MLGVSVRKMKELAVKMETVTLIGKGRYRYNLTCFVYHIYAINTKMFFLSKCFIFVLSSWIIVFLHSRKYGNCLNTDFL